METKRAITVGVAPYGMIVGNVSWIILVLMLGALAARFAVKYHFIGKKVREKSLERDAMNAASRDEGDMPFLREMPSLRLLTSAGDDVNRDDVVNGDDVVCRDAAGRHEEEDPYLRLGLGWDDWVIVIAAVRTFHGTKEKRWRGLLANFAV